MKNLKFACLSLIIMLASCSKNDENNQVAADKSAATRIYLNAVKESDSPLSQSGFTVDDFCFTLVFPINVIYNNGNEVTINSMNGLKEAIYSENFTFHINTIVYPFSINYLSNNETLAVENESQFLDLLSECNIDTIDTIITAPNCFEFVFPLSVIKNDGTVQEVTNLTSLTNLLNSMNPNEYWVDFQYPFQIIYNNENVTINDIWEFFNYLDCSPVDSCFCPTDINPVCVQTSNGIVQFDNVCWAQCAGYTEANFVNCN